jgi:acetylornithine deacetylase
VTLTDLTRDLVAIPSHEDETAAGDRIETWLRTETDAVVVRDEQDNVIARKPAAGQDAVDENRPSLALVGHHDVVVPDDSQVTDDGRFRVEHREGRLHGRGTADMKGAVAALAFAFRDADPACDLVFASFVGEVYGGIGARGALDRGFAPDYAVVGEGSTDYSVPGVTDVVVVHKGRRGSTITARGESAHASEPQEGENAVYRACDAVDVVRDLQPPAAELSVLDRRVEGSVVVTKIEGGDAWNVIPDRCTVTVDERTVPGSRADLDRVERIDGVSWTVDQDLPPMECEDPEFADAALDAAADAQEGDPEHVIKPHATDAGWLAGAGTACLVCGAAEPGEAHTRDESVSVAVLNRCRDIYLGIAERFDPSDGRP